MDCNHFVADCFCLSELLITYCSDLEKKKKNADPREKVWSTGFYPNLFLSHNDWYVSGRIGQQMEKKKKNEKKQQLKNINI